MKKETKDLILMIKKEREYLLNNGLLYMSGRSEKPNDPTQLVMLYDILLAKITEEKEAA